VEEIFVHTLNEDIKYFDLKCDPQKLELLVDLRKKVGLSQSEAARFFDMSDYGSVAAWELGKSKPLPTRRQRFIVYLLDKLLLRRNPDRFFSVWTEIMVGEWGWPPLSDEESQNAFPGQKALAPDLSWLELPFADHANGHDNDLAHLTQLLAELQSVVYRLLDK
jgi:transcriptional regulator with XRE-family HTH domain